MNKSSQESGDNLGGETAYKLSEENIQLFMEYVYIYSNHGKVTQLSVSPTVCSFFNRCEEYAKKETEMEQTVSFIPQYKHMFVTLVSV